MKRKKASRGVLIDVALLLLCLLCVTTCLSSGILAKFASRAADTETARVAGFAVSASAKQDPDDPLKYSVTVKNESETAVEYSLELVFDRDITGIIKVTVNGHEYEATAANGSRIIIPALGTLATGSKSKTVELVFTAGNLTEPIDFDTFVRFEQVD